jgi:hypothetical protein
MDSSTVTARGSCCGMRPWMTTITYARSRSVMVKYFFVADFLDQAGDVAQCTTALT